MTKAKNNTEVQLFLRVQSPVLTLLLISDMDLDLHL